MRIGKYKTRGFFKNRGRAIAASLGCRKDSVDSRWSDYDLRRERRCELISAYLHLLEKMNEPIASETVLPASKEQIRCAIFHELTEQPGSDRRHHLEIAYVQLESFVPQDEYRVVADFKKALFVEQELIAAVGPEHEVCAGGTCGERRGENLPENAGEI